MTKHTDSLSMDARIIANGFFMSGSTSTLRIGGDGAKGTFTKRAKAAIEELIAGGYVIANRYNNYGRMQYKGTEKLDTLIRPTFDEMQEHAAWPATVNVDHIDAADLSDHAAKYPLEPGND